MSWSVLIAGLAVVALSALAMFLHDELEAMARRAWHRIRWGRVMDCGR